MKAPSRSLALLVARLVLVAVGGYSALLAVGPGASAPAVTLPGAPVASSQNLQRVSQ